MKRKRMSFRSHCGSKRQFPNYDDARDALIGLRNDPDVSGVKGMKAYRCDYGDHWHIGHVR